MFKKTPSAKKLQYRDFVDTFTGILNHTALDKLPRIIIIYGPSDYLILRSLDSLKKKWHEHTCASIDAQSLGNEQFHQIAEMSSIFASRTVYVIKKVDKKGDISKYLSEIASTDDMYNVIIMTYHGATLNPKFKNEADRLGAYLVACFEPGPAELNAFIIGIGKKHSLQLDASACELLKECLGADLFQLENEIEKLSMIFKNGSRPTASEIAPHLGLLREDHIFEIETLLLNRQKAKAQALIGNLLQRGESSLALLGVLAGYCRKSLKIMDLVKKGCPPAQIAEKLRLPMHVVKTYQASLVGRSEQVFIRSLSNCGKADIELKTTRHSAELALSNIVLELPNQ